MTCCVCDDDTCCTRGFLPLHSGSFQMLQLLSTLYGLLIHCLNALPCCSCVCFAVMSFVALGVSCPYLLAFAGQCGS
jgi:hypothetical protein